MCIRDRDYKRAILLGSTTVGKATMQSILPLDSNSTAHFAKVTINKFYRINGTSHQGIGIIPNIKLPSIYENINPRESNSLNALLNDSISSNLNYRLYINSKTVARVVENSSHRIAMNTYYNEINQINNFLSELEVSIISGTAVCMRKAISYCLMRVCVSGSPTAS